jgi:hypothetical protein
MSEGQQLKFQGGSTPKPEGDQRSHRGQDRKHAGHDKAVGAKLQYLPDIRNFEKLQVAWVSWRSKATL